MTENTDEKLEKNQFMGMIEKDKIIVTNEEAIDEF